MTGLPPSLPAVPHVPGSGTVPDLPSLEAAKAGCPARVTEANWQGVGPYRTGIALYAAGYFWEAHEVWEPVWMACPPASRERSLLACLIQVANACLKLRMGRMQAARRLVAIAGEHLAQVGDLPPGHLLGQPLGALAAELSAFRQALAAAEPTNLEDLLMLRPALHQD